MHYPIYSVSTLGKVNCRNFRKLISVIVIAFLVFFPLLMSNSELTHAQTSSTCNNNLTIPKSGVSADGYQAGYPPTATIDGYYSTMWIDYGLPSSIKYDLGTSKRICE